MNRLLLACSGSLALHIAVFLGLPSEENSAKIQAERSQTIGLQATQLSIAVLSEQTKIKKEEPKPIVKKLPKKKVVKKKKPLPKVAKRIAKPTPLRKAPSETTQKVKNSLPIQKKKGNALRQISAADYARNTPIKYPRLARRRNQTGEALLLVAISATGTALDVKIRKSSGHKLLDRAAVHGVKKWTFTPAQNGEHKMASKVLVPIRFQLN